MVEPKRIQVKETIWQSINIIATSAARSILNTAQVLTHSGLQIVMYAQVSLLK